MPDNDNNPQITSSDALSSLASAADAARQAYLIALQANPGADLSALYLAEMKALSIWSSAQSKVLNNDSAATTAKANLDSATQVIRSELSTIKNISTWVALVNNLVQLAATVGKFFA